jgi:hypothetical protein
MISFHQAAAAAAVVADDDDGSGLWLPETANLMGTQSQKSSSPQHFSEKSCTQPIHPAHHPPITITEKPSLCISILLQDLYIQTLTQSNNKNKKTRQKKQQKKNKNKNKKQEQNKKKTDEGAMVVCCTLGMPR